MKRTYQEKVENITNWVKIVNYHWQRLNGQVNNDKEFWSQTLEAMTNEDWWDWVDIFPALKAQHPDAFAKYPYAEIGTDHITKKLHKMQPVVKPSVAGRNFEAFRTLMNIKDVINFIEGTPTIQFTKKKIERKKKIEAGARPASTFNVLFDIYYK